MKGQWLCIHSSTWALQECPRVMCSPHSSPPLQFCEQGLPSSHSPWGRRGMCREKGLGTRVGDQLPQWCAGPRLSESRSGSGRVETQCLHVEPPCKLVMVHAFRELGGVRLQASKHGLPPTPGGAPSPSRHLCQPSIPEMVQRSVLLVEEWVPSQHPISQSQDSHVKPSPLGGPSD